MSDVIARFDAVIADQWEPHAAPTPESVARIEERFGCCIPPLLLEFASKSKSFSSYFLSLGPDFQSHSNLVTRNEMVRSHPDWLALGPRAPDHLVFITDNFMDDFFWCLDVRKTKGEHPIVYWTPSFLSSSAPRYESFEHFIAAELASYESRRTV
jgi:hypothetical protein